MGEHNNINYLVSTYIWINLLLNYHTICQNLSIDHNCNLGEELQSNLTQRLCDDELTSMLFFFFSKNKKTCGSYWWLQKDI